MLKFFLFFILSLYTAFSEVAAINYDDEGDLVLTGHQFVSLGGLCHTALALRGNNLRKAAFPFDWTVSTKYEGLIRVLDDDFLFYTDEDCFDLYEGVPYVHNTYYSIVFPHDFNIDIVKIGQGREQWNEFKTKYDRRVARFRSLREYPYKVFFVRAFWTELTEGQDGQFNENTKRATELKYALDRYFPDLDFTLIILSYNDLPIPPLEYIEGVVEFRIGRSHKEFYDRACTLY